MQRLSKFIGNQERVEVLTERKRADKVGIGEEFAEFEFEVGPALNRQYVDALQADPNRYKEIVHPGLLLFYSNITRSPSHYLPSGTATVHAKEETNFHNPAYVGKTFRVYWKVIDIYEKRGNLFQVKKALILDEDGQVILERTINDTHLSGRR